MITLPSYVVDFMKAFRSAGYEIYLVGGGVRDLLLGKTTTNWDFTTDARPEKIQELFPDSFYNNAYGTVGVSVEEGKNKLIFEVTPFRTEGEYKDHRHPDEVTWAKTLEEDLSRRDFTINAIAFDGTKIIDPYQGQEHLKQKLIVAVGDADKRFKEDALRLMRAVRFASQLGFTIEDKTRESIRTNAQLITKIAWERIRDELLKIIASDYPAEGVLFLRSCGILEFILPEVSACFEIPQKSPKRHHIYDVGTHLVMSLKHCPSQDVITRFAAFLHDVGKLKTFRKDEESELITFYNHEVVGARMAEKIADRFKLSKKDKTKLVLLVRQHQFTVNEDQTDKAIRRFIRNVGLEYLDDMLAVRVGDRLGGGATATSWRLELFKKRLEEVQQIPFSVKDLKINGEDVMKTLSLKPGPEVGKILATILEQVEEGKIKNEKKELLKSLSSK